MTIKILKKGVVPPPKIVLCRGECSYCSTQIECELIDTYTEFKPGDTRRLCKCPLCYSSIEVKITTNEQR